MFFLRLFLLTFVKTGTTKSKIKECERENIDILLTKSFNRFGHDAKEGLEAIKKYEWLGKELSSRKIR